MSKYSVVVIGGGAAGICAAITAARAGHSVVIVEKTAQLGKKILASGDGRCNLLNENFTADFFNPSARALVSSVISQYGKSDILDYFHELGLQVYSREGRIFPVTNQSASVLKVLEMELRRFEIPIEYNFACVEIKCSGAGFELIAASGGSVEGGKVVITGGGRAYPAFGSDGSAYDIARKLGHSIVEPVPAVVPLVVKDNLCQRLQGQRILAGAWSIVNNKTGEVVHGELLFTKYGLSGTCILDVSEAISIAINRDHRTDVEVAVDLVPFLSRDQLKNELTYRLRKSIPPAELLCGILPNKCAIALQPVFAADRLDMVVNALKNRRFKVMATRGWNEAEFTSGGINVAEIKLNTLESKMVRGIYFAGEILDVNGKRGGYNLGWAWSSGMTAGNLS
jgi:predicted Rossmann fold flavoprotein